MIRRNKPSFPVVVGMVSILTAALVLTGCTEKNKSDEENIVSDEAVLYIDEEPVSEEEYRMLAEEYCNQVYMQYTTEQVNSDGFWQTEIDGTAPWEVLDELVREELKKNYTLKKLAVELSVTEDYTFQDLLEAGEQENASRAEAKESEDQTVYGLTSFDDATYYKYWYSNLETQVINTLIQEEGTVTEKDCKDYYEANPDEFTYETGVSVIYAEISYSEEDTQAYQDAKRVEKAMESIDSLSDLSEEFPDISFQELELNSLDTQEGMSGIYSHRWELASQLEQGQTYGPYEDNGMLCILKCIDRTENGSMDFETAKGQIERYLQVQEAQDLISSEEEETDIKDGNKPPEDIIASLE